MYSMPRRQRAARGRQRQPPARAGPRRHPRSPERPPLGPARLLIELVEKAMMRDRAARFRDARSMREAVACELLTLYPSGPRRSPARARRHGEARRAPSPPRLRRPRRADRAQRQADVPPPYPPPPVPSGAFDATHVTARATPYERCPRTSRSRACRSCPRTTSSAAATGSPVPRQGGMGAVYEAEDEELREEVAPQTMRPELARIRRPSSASSGRSTSRGW